MKKRLVEIPRASDSVVFQDAQDASDMLDKVLSSLIGEFGWEPWVAAKFAHASVDRMLYATRRKAKRHAA